MSAYDLPIQSVRTPEQPAGIRDSTGSDQTTYLGARHHSAPDRNTGNNLRLKSELVSEFTERCDIAGLLSPKPEVLAYQNRARSCSFSQHDSSKVPRRQFRKSFVERQNERLLYACRGK